MGRIWPRCRKSVRHGISTGLFSQGAKQVKSQNAIITCITCPFVLDIDADRWIPYWEDNNWEMCYMCGLHYDIATDNCRRMQEKVELAVWFQDSVSKDLSPGFLFSMLCLFFSSPELMNRGLPTNGKKTTMSVKRFTDHLQISRMKPLQLRS